MNTRIVLLCVLCLGFGCASSRSSEKETRIIENTTVIKEKESSNTSNTVEKETPRTKPPRRKTTPKPQKQVKKDTLINIPKVQDDKGQYFIRACLTVTNGVIDHNIHLSTEYGNMEFLFIKTEGSISKIYELASDGRIIVFEAENKNGDQIVYGYELKERR